MPSRNGHGAHEAPRRRRGRRAGLIGAVLVVALLAFGGGYLLARGDGAETVPPSSGTPASSPTEETSPSGTSPTSGPSPSPIADSLADGRHFVFVESATASPGSLRFDLAEFLTGAEAEQAAQDRGDEVVSGYYIVNDNPRCGACLSPTPRTSGTSR